MPLDPLEGPKSIPLHYTARKTFLGQALPPPPPPPYPAQKPCYSPEKSKQRVAHSLNILISALENLPGNCTVFVSFFPRYKGFFLIVPQPKFYICSTSVSLLYTHFQRTVYLLNFKIKLLLQSPCLLSGLF